MSAQPRAGPARGARSAGRAGASAGTSGKGRGAATRARRSPHVQDRRPAPRRAVGARRALVLGGGGRDRWPAGGRRKRGEAERKEVGLRRTPLSSSGGRGGSGGCAAAAGFGSGAPGRAAAALCRRRRRALRPGPRYRLLPGGRNYRRHPPAHTAARGSSAILMIRL
ncbi:methyl-CpG-binding domain protein 2-like [Prionailurus viverrinus]|uniref:methyl-CpG-binding domain protein 2-like n=1 Tax=Felis catus TaxID=9685 RepID=UPI001D19A0DF|nr:methyl-CpG-binding domain protein 2-like [Felis catus]XP_047694797.1 methyl-CpG-binding domain protein 2-like [Prionailurus viverrinus]